MASLFQFLSNGASFPAHAAASPGLAERRRVDCFPVNSPSLWLALTLLAACFVQTVYLGRIGTVNSARVVLTFLVQTLELCGRLADTSATRPFSWISSVLGLHPLHSPQLPSDAAQPPTDPPPAASAPADSPPPTSAPADESSKSLSGVGSVPSADTGSPPAPEPAPMSSTEEKALRQKKAAALKARLFARFLDEGRRQVEHHRGHSAARAAFFVRSHILSVCSAISRLTRNTLLSEKALLALPPEQSRQMLRIHRRHRRDRTLRRGRDRLDLAGDHRFFSATVNQLAPCPTTRPRRRHQRVQVIPLGCPAGRGVARRMAALCHTH